MSFDDGFILGLSMASGSSDPDPDPEPEWQPPTDWIPVPEPGDYELHFLVAKEGSFTFGVELYEPDFSYRTECTVNWGDGTIEDFNQNNRPEHSYTNGGMFLVKITLKDNIPCLFNNFYYGSDSSVPVLIAKIGDEILTNNTGHNDGPFYYSRNYIKQIKIGGKDGIQARCFQNFINLVKFDSTTPLDVIPDWAFGGCYSLKNIDLSNVTSIGESAFYQCRSLGIVNATNLERIGNYAFYECYKLTTINASNVINIGDYAFQDCHFLKSVDLPKLTEINNGTFHSCHALKTINAPEVTTVGDYAFAYCRSLDVIDLPKVTSFGANAAAYSAVSKVNMPACTSIGDSCFSYCYNLDSPKDFVVAENCTYGNYCFYGVVIYPPIA